MSASYLPNIQKLKCSTQVLVAIDKALSATSPPHIVIVRHPTAATPMPMVNMTSLLEACCTRLWVSKWRCDRRQVPLT